MDPLDRARKRLDDLRHLALEHEFHDDSWQERMAGIRGILDEVTVLLAAAPSSPVRKGLPERPPEAYQAAYATAEDYQAFVDYADALEDHIAAAGPVQEAWRVVARASDGSSIYVLAHDNLKAAREHASLLNALRPETPYVVQRQMISPWVDVPTEETS